MCVWGGDEIVSARVRRTNSRSGVVHEWQCCTVSPLGYFAGRSCVAVGRLNVCTDSEWLPWESVFRDFSHMFPCLY